MNKKISKFDKFVNEASEVFINKLKKFFDKFPNDATAWEFATDELRDMARFIKELNNDLSTNKVEALNFKEFKTPSEWNAKSKEYILNVFDKLDEYGKNEFMEYFDAYYN